MKKISVEIKAKTRALIGQFVIYVRKQQKFPNFIEIISMKGCVTVEQNFAGIPGKFLF